MFRFIKEAVKVVVPESNISLHKGIVCIIFCMDSTESLTSRFDSFDLSRIAKKIKSELILHSSGNKILSECTALDYASLYESIYGGNSIFFLRTYQDYIGQIE